MQILIKDSDLNRLVTGKDIGKLVAFMDNPEGNFITYGILNEVNLGEDFPYTRKGDFSQWRYARRLTKEEIEELL